MKKPLLILFVFHLALFFCTQVLCAQGTWTVRDTLPNDSAMFQGLPGFSIGSYGYAGLGEGTGATPQYNDFWQFNPSNNSWMKKANFPGSARVAPACFVICDKAYVVCGSVKNAGACVNECWEYDATNNTWTQKANFPGPARVYAAGFAIDSLGYVGTGANELSNFRKDFYAYHPSTNTWTRIADFGGIARSGDAGFAVNGKGYVCFGQDSTIKYYKDMWEYDPLSNTWTRKSDYPKEGLIGSSGFAICNNIYVGVGDSVNFDLDRRFWKYNTLLDTWTQEANFPGKTTIQGASFAVNDTGYYGFGADSVGRTLNKFCKFYAGDTCPNLGACPTNGIQEVQNVLSFSMYPDPVAKFLNLDISKQFDENITISVMDIYGRIVLTSQLSTPYSQFSLDVSSLSSGMYFINLRANNICLTRKFIKQNK